MSDALTLPSRRLKQYVDLALAACFSGWAKPVSPSYFANVGFFQGRSVSKLCVALPKHLLGFEDQFFPVTAFVAIV